MFTSLDLKIELKYYAINNVNKRTNGTCFQTLRF